MNECHEGYEVVILSEEWITRNNFTYLYRIQQCEKVSGPISPLFYVISGTVLCLWILIMCIIIVRSMNRVKPYSLEYSEGSSTISRYMEAGPSVYPNAVAAAAASVASRRGDGNV